MTLTAPATNYQHRDYGMLGPDAETAVRQGLKSAEWYHTDIPRKEMKELMKRTDGPATRFSKTLSARLARASRFNRRKI
jgi:hypothetical protein